MGKWMHNARRVTAATDRRNADGGECSLCARRSRGRPAILLPILLGLTVATLVVGLAMAQERPPAPPAASAATADADGAGRAEALPYHESIRYFDFEEPYGEPLPIDWQQVRGPKFPAYTRGRLVNDVAHDGEMSFRIDLNGGNCSYQYDRRRMAVQDDYDFCVEGWIRTDGLEHSGASLAAWLEDARGEPLDGSRVRSEAVGGTTDGWALRRVYVSSTSNAAGKAYDRQPRYLRLSMDVLSAGVQDIGGRVWFDDIRVYRLPRVRLMVAGGVFHDAGDDLELSLQAEGLGERQLDGWLMVRTSRGHTVSRGQVRMQAGKPGQPATHRATVSSLAPGIYEIVFDVSAERPSVLRRWSHVAVLAPWQSPKGLRGVGFGIEDLSGLDDPTATAAVVAASGVGAVKVRLWNRSTNEDEIRLGRPATVRLLDALGRQGVECIGVLGKPPDILAAETAALRPGIMDLFGQPKSTYESALGFTVSRYCGPVHRWQIGEVDDSSVLRLHQDSQLPAAALAQMDRLTAAQAVSLAWPALYSLPSRLPERLDAVSLRIDQSIGPAELVHYLPERAAGGKQGGGHVPPAVQLTFAAADAGQHDADGRLIDFVHRVLAAKVAGVDEIFFEHLVDSKTGLMQSARKPDELLLVVRTLSDMLGSARYIGPMQLESGGHALVFERADGSEVLVLWHDDPRGTVTQPLYLGRELYATDIWGRRSRIPTVDRLATVAMGRLPVFVTGIDARLSRTRRSFTLRGGVIEASYQRHTVQLQFENGFSMPLVGQIRLRAPDGWKLDPQFVSFHLAAGERATVPVTVVVPYDETTGMKEIIGDFHVPGDAPLRFRALAPVHLEMKSARTAALGYVRDGRLIIEQEITNRSDAPITLRAYVQVPGRPMVSHMITDLKPLATVTRTYELPFETSLTGKQALVGIREEGISRGFSNVLVPIGDTVRRSSQ